MIKQIINNLKKESGESENSKQNIRNRKLFILASNFKFEEIIEISKQNQHRHSENSESGELINIKTIQLQHVKNEKEIHCDYNKQREEISKTIS
jgi:hypothetical protein